MEISIIIALIVIAGTVWYVNRDRKIDANNDGKIDLADAALAARVTVEGVKAMADVNKDGKVDAADVKAVATKAKAGAKKAVVKAKSAAKTATKRRSK
jgi:hypothetical protein